MQGPGRELPAGGFPMTEMGVIMVVWLLMMAPFVVGWVIFLIALWRGMKAHERIASALDILAQRLPGSGAG